MIPVVVTVGQYQIANIYWNYPTVLTAEMVQEALDWFYGDWDD
jgi:hypothetical protein